MKIYTNLWQQIIVQVDNWSEIGTELCLCFDEIWRSLKYLPSLVISENIIEKCKLPTSFLSTFKFSFPLPFFAFVHSI